MKKLCILTALALFLTILPVHAADTPAVLIESTNPLCIGSAALSDGLYLDESGNVTDTIPEGGHAYLKDGVLTLTDFDLACGAEDLRGLRTHPAAISASFDLTIALVGDNTIVSNDTNGSYAICADTLTFTGDGNLTVSASHGLRTEHGAITLGSGAYDITATTGHALMPAAELLINGTVDIAAGDAGVWFDASGTVSIGNSGALHISTASNNCIHAGGTVTLSGGDYHLTSAHTGVYGETGVLIENGAKLHIRAKDGIISGGNAAIEHCTVNADVTDYGIRAESVAGLPTDIAIRDSFLSITGAQDSALSAKGIITLTDAAITAPANAVFKETATAAGTCLDVYDADGKIVTDLEISGHTERQSPVNTEPLPYTDVAETDWYYDAVAYVTANKLLQGTDETTFAPRLALLCGTIADFFGLREEALAPEETMTREYFVYLLWEHAKANGVDVSVGEDTNILSYLDAFDIGEKYIPAIQWACGAGVMRGNPDGALAPQRNVTRAEAATMLQRYLTK